MPRAPAEAGFTLIELLVALAIFSLAALALLNLAGENARAGARLGDRALAEVVLDNRAVEVMTSPAPLAIGRTAGVEMAGRRPWAWVRQVSRTSDPALIRVDLAVSAPRGRTPYARATLFRAAR